MLIQFSVKNFRSFRDRQTLSLVRGKGDEHGSTHSFEPQFGGSLPLLRAAAIYGPNASGKSNLLRALSVMRQVVVDSAAASQRGEKIGVTPFLFDESTNQEPTEFEVVFLVSDTRYQYGFSATQDRVHEEWLMAFPKGRMQRWFNRTYDDAGQDYIWEMGDKLTGQKQLWQEATRSNALFFSTAVQLNSTLLQPIFDWFQSTLHVVMNRLDSVFTASLCEKDASKERVLAFLRAADLGVADLLVKRRKFDPHQLPADMPATLRQGIIEEFAGKEINALKTVHTTAQGGQVELDFEHESNGTRKFFSFAGPWLDTLEHGYVLVIDELHDNLHPHLVKFLVDLFHDSRTNPKNAQLIFSTHETSILSQDVFRRDQIWFCEKDDNTQASRIFPLTDFSPRKGLENLERSYLAGRYGALPYFREVDLAMGGNGKEQERAS
ncbi:MAG: AAA family ATPase [Deltaproteobacteria bacterium]|nr:AAA family ATPase [Deltaproteobacteria bacterium]